MPQADRIKHHLSGQSELYRAFDDFRSHCRDDDVTPRGRNGSVANFFQRKYDLYLEQYERHVRLAERIHRMRGEAEESPGNLQRREWEDKLGRAHDAIERTTQRLDLLEHHYPELATDSDRLSHRLELARLQAELAERQLRD